MNGREHASYHEAGHVVAALALGGSVELARLDGTMTVLPHRAPAGVVALAGPCAEARWQRRAVPPVDRWPPEWRHDLTHWRRLVGVPDVADARGLWLDDHETADRHVRGNWAAVTVVAHALVDRGALSGTEVARLIDHERARLAEAHRAGALVGRSDWPQYALVL